jgi:hypothetical protein
MKMTMANVVGNYLRWFELKRAKRAIAAVPSFAEEASSWRRSVFPRRGAAAGDEDAKNSSESLQESSGKTVR